MFDTKQLRGCVANRHSICLVYAVTLNQVEQLCSTICPIISEVLFVGSFSMITFPNGWKTGKKVETVTIYKTNAVINDSEVAQYASLRKTHLDFRSKVKATVTPNVHDTFNVCNK